MSITTANQEVTADEALERARGIAKLADEQSAECEALGMLTKELDDALHESGLYGMWVPKSLGGLELDPLTSIEVIETVARGQSSAGWVLMAAGLSVGTGAAYLGDEAIAEIFTDVDRWPIIAGQGTRPGTAKRVDGGFQISGDWSFGSGLKHSQYIHSAVVTDDTGEFRITVVPVEKANLEQDSWNVLGLKATGSIDYQMRDVFVPEHFTHNGLQQESTRGGALYKLGIIQIALICHSGWGLGTARRLLDELAASAQKKAGRAGQIAESDAFQMGFADAEAKLRAARALVFESWRDAWETLVSGGELSTRQGTLLRLALEHVTWTMADVAQFVYKNGGTSALRDGTVQRFFRDANAGTQHITSAPGVVKAAGKELAGLAPDHQWVFLDIVDPNAAAPAAH
jgi:alkylation response protein AidB-like acyl-CoA dehydrogenase